MSFTREELELAGNVFYESRNRIRRWIAATTGYDEFMLTNIDVGSEYAGKGLWYEAEYDSGYAFTDLSEVCGYIDPDIFFSSDAAFDASVLFETEKRRFAELAARREAARAKAEAIEKREAERKAKANAEFLAECKRRGLNPDLIAQLDD